MTLVALDRARQPLALGSGFFVDSNGTVATNAHVVQGAASVVVRWKGQSGSAVNVIGFESSYDLALVQTSHRDTPPVRLGDSDTVTVGEEVVASGNPLGLEGTVSNGILSGLRESGGVRYLQISAPISPGSSGGPVFNRAGSVIGVATASIARGQNLNFAVPVNLLAKLPRVELQFDSIRASSLSDSDASSWRDLVRLTGLMEHASETLRQFNGVTFSIHNRSPDPIRDVAVVVVVRNYDNDVVDFTLRRLDMVIPPGLAKQVHVEHQVVGYYSNPSVDQYRRSRKGWVEIRILDFTVMRGASALDPVWKR